MSEQPWWRPALAEFLGTLALVFMGAGSIITLNQLLGGARDGGFLVGVALAHGLAIAVMIMAVGHVSGGHFNPAVTSAFLFTKRIRTDLGLIYIAFQLLGGVTAAFLLNASLPSNWWQAVHLGVPEVHTSVSSVKAMLVEAILTFFLVFVIFGSAVDKRNHMSVTAGLAIGLTITVDILMGGYVTGAAMNPARWFGPALIGQYWASAWVYIAGPLLGGILAGLVYDSSYLQPLKPPEKPMATPDVPKAEMATPPPQNP